jgi:hypothetical protein
MVDCPSLQILLSYLPDAPGKIKKPRNLMQNPVGSVFKTYWILD